MPKRQYYLIKEGVVFSWAVYPTNS